MAPIDLFSESVSSFDERKFSTFKRSWKPLIDSNLDLFEEIYENAARSLEPSPVEEEEVPICPPFDGFSIGILWPQWSSCSPRSSNTTSIQIRQRSIEYEGKKIPVKPGRTRYKTKTRQNWNNRESSLVERPICCRLFCCRWCRWFILFLVPFLSASFRLVFRIEDGYSGLLVLLALDFGHRFGCGDESTSIAIRRTIDRSVGRPSHRQRPPAVAVRCGERPLITMKNHARSKHNKTFLSLSLSLSLSLFLSFSVPLPLFLYFRNNWK